MHHRPRALAALTLLAAFLPFSAGCGSNPQAQPRTSTDTSTAGDQAVKFAQCMREHGVGGFPDPDADGELTVDAVANEGKIDTGSAAWEQAIAACKHLQPSGFTGRKRSSTQQDAALEFAGCMRKSGVPDFPDPAAGEPLIDTNRIPSSDSDAGMDALNAAMQRCGSYAAKMGVTRP